MTGDLGNEDPDFPLFPEFSSDLIEASSPLIKHTTKMVQRAFILEHRSLLTRIWSMTKDTKGGSER